MDIVPIQFPSIPNIGAITPAAAPTAPTGPSGIGAVADTEFGSLVLDGLDRLEGLTDKADTLAVQAATGNLDNIHDYTIAASEASVASQLTVAVRNRAVEAFNEIMRMQV
ncbi:flagellar hook-basal body protein FliE [Nocardioides sp. Root190]|uniref:flagellar hook-basal body complex protein FliE n=1 Tax=Nocardioides sp. Root190 TaxID=1736488 RepID=UPI0006FD1C7E|nr:flagellar hook-basal body complex protein FliE [Nocardioides sp. Root190]KRB79954.1 flagellar hook-basal body protein FliE [Nocardioides sp. Root190]